MIDTQLQDLLDHVRTRFYGKYRGVVTDVDAATCVPYAGPQVGFVMLPERGSGVWIEFEGGDVSFPIWTGCYWNNGDVPDDASADVKSIVTKAGSLQFDNQKASVTAQVSSDQKIVLDDSGVTISSSSGQQVAVGTSSVSVNNDALEIL
jgi:uncharacterized protein involved in type VI secretion and phage assembly